MQPRIFFVALPLLVRERGPSARTTPLGAAHGRDSLDTLERDVFRRSWPFRGDGSFHPLWRQRHGSPEPLRGQGHPRVPRGPSSIRLRAQSIDRRNEQLPPAYREPPRIAPDRTPGESRLRDLNRAAYFLSPSVGSFADPPRDMRFPIRIRDVPSDRNSPMVLALIALHDDLGSGRQGIFVEAEPEQGVGAAPPRSSSW